MLVLLARTRRQEILGASAMVGLGVLIEVLQHLVYRHPMEWLDITDDSLAVLATLAIYYQMGSRKVGPICVNSDS
jgi:hypothetical protein